MKRIVLGIVVLFLLIMPCAGFAQSTMTDQQVLDYAQKAMASGKKQSDIVKELALKGVDRAQAARVKMLYEAQMGGKDNVAAFGTPTKQRNGNGYNAVFTRVDFLF